MKYVKDLNLEEFEENKHKITEIVSALEERTVSLHDTINIQRTHFGTISQRPTLMQHTYEGQYQAQSKTVLEKNTSIALQEIPDAHHAFEVEVGVPIGEGGFSTVYSAEQRCLQREVAIKVPHSHRMTRQYKHLLIEEAHRIARLEHPNIMPVYSLGYDKDENPILIMKKIEGVTWLDIIVDDQHDFWEQQKGDRLRQHLKILIQVCHALEYAHSKNIIHRDIKADNVMIGSFGEVYLLDWGIAVELDEMGVYTPTGFCGTPVCAAPEMVIPQFPLNIQTDVYLLGSLLHRILTKEERHKGKDLSEIFFNICRGNQHQYPRFIHPNLASICHKANALLPQDRYGSVRLFREDIERYLLLQETLVLLEKSKHKFDLFELELQAELPNEYKIHQYAFQCRFGFQNVLDRDSSLQEAHDFLIKSIVLHFQFEIQQGQLNTARRILTELQELSVDLSIIMPLKKELKDEEDRRQRSNELTTQIQYKLLEQIQKLKET